MVCMVAIRRVVLTLRNALNQQKTKAILKQQALNLHPVSERIRIDAQVVSLLCESERRDARGSNSRSFPCYSPCAQEP